MQTNNDPLTPIEVSAKAEVLIYKQNPATISYAENFTSLKDNNKITTLTIAAFEQLIRKNSERKNFQWSESVLTEELLPAFTVTDQDIIIDGEYNGTIDGLVVFNMGAQLGYGVATVRPIKKNTFITHYSGKITNKESARLQLNILTSSYAAAYDAIHVVDAIELGNIAAFIQDAPTDEELKTKYVWCGDSATEIATANINMGKGVLQGQRIIFMRALRDIAAGEMLLVSYGDGYWEIKRLIFNKHRLLFTNEGTIIPPNFYEYIGGTLKLKFNTVNYVEIPYNAVKNASLKQQSLRYEFMRRPGQTETRELSLSDIRLIMDKTLWSTSVDPDIIPLKSRLMERLWKEYQLQAILFRFGIKISHQLFFSKGLMLYQSMLSGTQQVTSDQVIACLLQALLFAIKEWAPNNELAAIYAALGNAYASKAKQECDVTYMAVAIYLLKTSLKLVRSPENIKHLQEYRAWQRQHATISFYCRNFFASLLCHLHMISDKY